MDPYSAFLSHLDSKIDVFKKEVLADVQSFIKETENIQESKENEITKLMKAIDDRTLCHENDKANWMKERDILLNQISNAEEPVQENEPDDLGFDGLAYLSSSIKELVYDLLKPEVKKGKINPVKFLIMVRNIQKEIVDNTLQLPAGRFPNTKGEVDEYMSSSKRRMIESALTRFDEALEKKNDCFSGK